MKSRWRSRGGPMPEVEGVEETAEAGGSGIYYLGGHLHPLITSTSHRHSACAGGDDADLRLSVLLPGGQAFTKRTSVSCHYRALNLHLLLSMPAKPAERERCCSCCAAIHVWTTTIARAFERRFELYLSNLLAQT